MLEELPKPQFVSPVRIPLAAGFRFEVSRSHYARGRSRDQNGQDWRVDVWGRSSTFLNTAELVDSLDWIVPLCWRQRCENITRVWANNLISFVVLNP